MKTNRRTFLSTSIIGGLAATIPMTSYGQPASAANSDALMDKYAKLDEILKQPIFKKRTV